MPLVLKTEDPFLAVDRERCARQKGQQDLMLLPLKVEEGTMSDFHLKCIYLALEREFVPAHL